MVSNMTLDHQASPRAEARAVANPSRVPIVDNDWEVIVVGAGPAGSSAAISAARLGLRVLLVDAKQFPRRKVCGGCLNQVSLGLAKQLLGAQHPLWSEALPLTGFRLQHAGRSFQFQLPSGLAVDRTQFDQSLVLQARADGVTFTDSTTAQLGDVCTDWRTVLLSGAQGAHTVRGKAVVLASGLGSRAAGEFKDLAPRAAADSRVGVEALFQDFPSHYSPGLIHMAVGTSGYVGLTQLADRRLHVAAAVDRRSLQQLGPAGCIRAILSQAQAPLLPDAPQLAWRGTPPLTCRAQRLADTRVFLVGDAAGYVEPFTGEGIRWGLQTGMGIAPLLARGVEAWDERLCHEWENWYRAHISPAQQICRRVTFSLKHTTTRWLAHRLLQFQPRLAQWVIARLNHSPSTPTSTKKPVP